jgi:hypothetical protein
MYRVVEHAVAVFKQALLHHVGASGGRGLITSWHWRRCAASRARHTRRNHAQFQPRRLQRAGAHQRRQQQVALQVVGGDGDGGLQRAGSKPAAVQSRASLPAARGTLRQRLGTRGGTMPRPARTNSGSPTMAAQLVQQVAHGRLRDAQAHGRARDRLLLHHRQQQLQQVAVEV